MRDSYSTIHHCIFNNSSYNDGNIMNPSSDAFGINSSSLETSVNHTNTETKKIRVGDINIAYQMFGQMKTIV
jgi:hypothetical protein